MKIWKLSAGSRLPATAVFGAREFKLELIKFRRLGKGATQITLKTDKGKLTLDLSKEEREMLKASLDTP